MRKALLAGVLLGAIAGLVFVHHDALRLTVAWPVILGFALWEATGDRGFRGVVVGAAAVLGAVLGWAAFAVPSTWMPPTDLSVGIVTGVLVGVMVVAGVLARDRFPLSAMLLGFAAFFGVFEPMWAQSPSNFKPHGLETLTVVWLGLLVGVLSAAAIRALTEGVRMRAKAPAPAPQAVVDIPAAELSEVLEGGGAGE